MSQPSGAHGETGATETKTNAASTDATLNARVKSPKPSGFNKWIPIIIAAVVTLAVITVSYTHLTLPTKRIV